MPEILIIYTTISSIEEAEQLATIAVESKLAACVNIIPNITSIYHWEDKIENSSECVLIFKTALKTGDDLLRFIADKHPYSLPAVFTTNMNTTDGFFTYIQNRTLAKKIDH